MPGKRQPTDIVKAKGLKHMTQAEEDARRDQEVHVPPPDKAVPPKWLPKKYHNEFCEIGEILRTAGLYAELDRDVLAQYFVCRERWLHADKLAAKPSGIRMRSWPRNGPASSPPISSRPSVCGVHGAVRYQPVQDRGAYGGGQCGRSRSGG